MIYDLMKLFAYAGGYALCVIGFIWLIVAAGNAVCKIPETRNGYRKQTEHERKISEYNKHRL